MIRLQTLGPTGLWGHDGREVTVVLAQPKRLALLAYLATATPRGFHRRDVLLPLFWPELSQDRARAALRKSLHFLRAALGADAIVGRGDGEVRLTSDALWCDAIAFEQALDARATEEALALYAGEFLHGLYVDDAPDLEDWLERQRAHLARRAREHAWSAADASLVAGDAALAARWGRWAVERSPGDEAQQQRLHALLARADVRAAAAAAVLPSAPELFVGREAELAELRRRLDRARAGHGQLCLVAGEAGVGKSSLMRAFAAHALSADPELVLLVGECNAQSGVGDPYLPFRDALAMLTGRTAGRLPLGAATAENARRLHAAMHAGGTALRDRAGALAGLVDAPPAQEVAVPSSQAQVLDRALGVLRSVAAHHAVVVVVEDLHWADAASVALLFYLARRIEHERLLIIGTYRPDEVAFGRDGERHPMERFANEMARSFGDVRVDLGALDERDGRQLVNRLVDAESNQLDEGFRTALLRHTEGFPLFTVELLRHLQARGSLVRDERRRWTAPRPIPWEALPAQVEGVIRERIDRLDAELREILVVASVEGEEFTAEVIARATGREVPRVVRRLGEELDREYRLVRALGVERGTAGPRSRYRFRHNLFQRFLYARLDPAERMYLHAAVAPALEALRAADPAAGVALAWQFEQGGDADRAVTYLIGAAASAQRARAQEEAIRHLQRAFVLLDGGVVRPADQVAALHEQLGDLQAAAGRGLEARAAFASALALVPIDASFVRARIQRRVGNSWMAQHRSDIALATYEIAERGMPEPVDAASPNEWEPWLQLQLDRMRAWYYAGMTEALAAASARVRPLIERRGSAAQRAEALENAVLAALRGSRYVPDDELPTVAQASLEAARASGSSHQVLAATFALGFVHLWADRLAVAEEWLHTTLKLARAQGDAYHRVLCYTYLAIARRRQGDAGTTRYYNRLALAEARAAEATTYIAAAEANAAWLAWRDGDAGEAAARGATAVEQWRASPIAYPFEALARWPRLAAALALDDVDVALDQARAILDPAQRPPPAATRAAVEAALTAEGPAVRAHLQRAAELARAEGWL